MLLALAHEIGPGLALAVLHWLSISVFESGWIVRYECRGAEYPLHRLRSWHLDACALSRCKCGAESAEQEIARQVENPGLTVHPDLNAVLREGRL